MSIALHEYAEAARRLAADWSAAHMPAARVLAVPRPAPAAAPKPGWVVPVVTTFHWPAVARPVRVVWWLPAFVRAWLPVS